jgi:hypothetical protein
MSPRTGLDDMERRKILPLPGLKLRPLGCPVCSVTILTALSWLPTDDLLAIIYTYIWVVCVPVCNLSFLFQKEEYEAYRANLLDMAADVRKLIIKLRKLKK